MFYVYERKDVRALKEAAVTAASNSSAAAAAAAAAATTTAAAIKLYYVCVCVQAGTDFSIPSLRHHSYRYVKVIYNGNTLIRRRLPCNNPMTQFFSHDQRIYVHGVSRRWNDETSRKIILESWSGARKQTTMTIRGIEFEIEWKVTQADLQAWKCLSLTQRRAKKRLWIVEDEEKEKR
ncbi:hypothetical protein V1478_017165, partial [Vespula squamosa]